MGDPHVWRNQKSSLKSTEPALFPQPGKEAVLHLNVDKDTDTQKKTEEEGSSLSLPFLPQTSVFGLQ